MIAPTRNIDTHMVTPGYPFRGCWKGMQPLRCTHKLNRINPPAAITKVRAWRGLGEVALRAGARNSNPPQVGSLGTFLPKQESTAAGRHCTTDTENGCKYSGMHICIPLLYLYKYKKGREGRYTIVIKWF